MPRAPHNRTLTLTANDRATLGVTLQTLSRPALRSKIFDRIICQDVATAAPFLPKRFVDLMIVDPPYNRTMSFGATTFRGRSHDDYVAWTDAWLSAVMHTLKPDASVYICAEWSSSSAVQQVAEKYFHVRNRITWEREKGRGAKRNWKNCSEDIWFCTVGKKYTFNIDAVKIERRVRAPYVDSNGAPKDWKRRGNGAVRLTHPSNVWTDLTVPFWSMPENTDHPTQKPEKMLAKIILAGSNPGDVIFDPFLGSGTTAVVARKLGRRFVGIEREREYCLLAAKRVALAAESKVIQGFDGGVFVERNSRKRI